jgi:hypothetical protein
MERTLLGDWGECDRVVKKDRCGSHTAHDLSTPRTHDGDFEFSVVKAVDRREMNGKGVNSVAVFA